MPRTAKLSAKEVAELERLTKKTKKTGSGGLINAIIGGLFALVWALVAGLLKLVGLLITEAVFPLLHWLVKQVFRFLRWGVVAGGKGLREMATGKHRGAFLPVWPILFASVIPLWAVPGWFALGLAFSAIWTVLWCVDHEWSLADHLPGQVGPRLHQLGDAVRAGGRSLRWAWTKTVGRKVFSERELLITSAFCFGLALGEAVRHFAPFWLWMPAMGLAIMYPATLWVDGRRIRPPAKLTKFQETWNLLVPKRLPEMAGTWLSWDDKRHQGVWELDDALANEVKAKTDEIELALSHELPEIRRGSLELKHNKREHVRHLVVRYTTDPIGDAAETKYFEGPTVDKQGRYLAGITPSGLAVHGRLIRKGGSAFTVVIASPGAGKGVLFRTMLANAFSAEWAYTVAIDGKGGTGIPWARYGADLYAWTPEQWALAIELTWEVLQARKFRYGKVGRDQWSPFVPFAEGEPCDPLFFLPIDEIQEVVKAWPAKGKVRTLATKMETISAQGRSVGVSGALSTQFGLVTDYWTNIIRTNFMGGGTTFIGKLGGRQAKQAAMQDVQDVDPSSLPDVNGWFVPISRIDDSVPRDAFRGVFLPTEADRQDGDSAPFGVAEDIIPKIVKWAKLHPDDQAIVDRYRQRWEATDSGLAVPPGTTALHSVPVGSGTGESEQDDEMDDGESRVLRALDEANLNTSELARRCEMNRPYLASDLLKRLESEGLIARGDDLKWRKVA